MLEASGAQSRVADSNQALRPSSIVQISRLTKTFRSGRKALNDVTMNVEPGQMVALIGASGSGKSTLLRNLAGLTVGDRSTGEVKMFGRTLQKNGILARDIRELRSRIGFVFQQFNLVGRLSLLTNVLAGTLGRVPVWRGTMGWFTRAEKEKAVEALRLVGIAEYAGQRASTLSGGQQQRAAIARALALRPRILLFDEPTSALDPELVGEVLKVIRDLALEGRTMLIVTHELAFARDVSTRVLFLHRGVIEEDGTPATVFTSSRSERFRQFIAGEGYMPASPRPAG
jgi:phosphonate transport system ATP-binding protein